MSCYEWERGTLNLPSAEVAPLRKALRDAANAHHDAVVALCKTLWAGPLGKTRSVARYRERLTAWEQAQRQIGPVAHDALEVLHAIGHPLRGTPRLRQATAADLALIAPRYTNRDVLFAAGEASIRFDGRDLTWSVPENNHARDHARAHHLAVVLFTRLERITWTRGTGGTIVGNDEYNRDTSYEGGGANYATATFGPTPRATRAARSGRSGGGRLAAPAVHLAPRAPLYSW